MNTDPLNNFPVVLYDPQQGRKIPEVQVNSTNNEYDGFEIFGEPVEINGGFMGPLKHNYKNRTY